MAIIAKSQGESTFKPVTEGLHQAICSGVVDLGIQPGQELCWGIITILSHQLLPLFSLGMCDKIKHQLPIEGECLVELTGYTDTIAMKPCELSFDKFFKSDLSGIGRHTITVYLG